MLYYYCVHTFDNIANAWITFGLRLVYGARILPVSPFPCGLCAEAAAEAGGGREIFVRIHGLRSLYDFVSREVKQIWKNRKPVARIHVVGCIAQSPHGHCPEASHWLCSKRTIFRWTWGHTKSYRDCRLVGHSHGHCTAIARLLLAARAVSVILSSHLCTEAAWAMYDFRAEAAETARLLHSNCTISVQSSSSLCTDLPWPAPEGQYNKWHDARR